MSDARIRDVQTGAIYPCQAGATLIVGRQAPGSRPDVPCDSRHVSRTHCHLRVEQDGRLRVEDRSSYGTWVNEQRVEGAGWAGPGDRIRLGDEYELEVLAGEPVDPVSPPVRRALVFTDLTGSLELKRRLGDGPARELIDRHRELVRLNLVRVEGREIDNPGDGFFLVFADGSAAVEFALHMQQAHSREHDLPPVRVGIHTGEVLERRGREGQKPVEVEGLAVDLAARIQDLAGPGQVLLSSAVRVEAEGRLSPTSLGEPVTWRRHGPFVFAGVEDCPLEVSEVVLSRLQDTLEAPQGGPKAERCARRSATVLKQRYAVVAELGRGSTGIVYRARDQLGQRDCAIKVLLASGRADPEQVQRFEREAVLAARLDHPGIVQVFDAGSWPHTGELFLAMELVEGQTLRGMLPALSLPQRVGILHQVADAVRHAHERGILHRDIKPANILVTKDDRAVLGDFGIAKALGEAGTVTITGHLLGTPSFIAPEQLTDSKRAGLAADVYALGAVLYMLLTGRAPFETGSLPATLVKVMRGEIEPPVVEPVLDALCMAAMSLDPDDRPTARGFLEGLETWLEAQPTDGPGS